MCVCVHVRTCVCSRRVRVTWPSVCSAAMAPPSALWTAWHTRHRHTPHTCQHTHVTHSCHTCTVTCAQTQVASRHDRTHPSRTTHHRTTHQATSAHSSVLIKNTRHTTHSVSMTFAHVCVCTFVVCVRVCACVVCVCVCARLVQWVVHTSFFCLPSGGREGSYGI